MEAYYTLFDIENLRVGFACAGECNGGNWHGKGGFVEVDEVRGPSILIPNRWFSFLLFVSRRFAERYDGHSKREQGREKAAWDKHGARVRMMSRDAP